MDEHDLRVSDLRCEYLVNPLGIDERAPRLSWRIESRRRGARQTAYRIRVASTLEKLQQGEADLWDSGQIESSRTTHIVYSGKPLLSRATCHWSVQVRDDSGASTESPPAFWTMGLLDRTDWTARWIAASPQIYERDTEAIRATLTEPGTPAVFGKGFRVRGKIARATLFATARGVFDVHLNGRRVSNDYFAPEWTDYHKRIQYRTYDVTDLVQAGDNWISATLGDGWWSGFVGWQETRARYGSLENSLLLQLEIEFIDGRRGTLGSDGSWLCNTGPILSSDFMMGEVYDARREQRLLSVSHFGDKEPAQFSESRVEEPAVLESDSGPNESWIPAREVAAPKAALVAQRSEPVRLVETITAVSAREIHPGTFIFDLGQNITGFVRLRVRAPGGTRITLRHGERLNPDGTLYTENLRRARATDVYICRGEGEEVWQPHFTFHGFQFVELTGCSGPVDVHTVTGCVIHSGLRPTGHFECSHPGVNRLWLNTLWSQRDNFLSVPTDCPQRDERLGWMGDAQVFLRTASYNMDIAAFFTKWMQDVEDAQTPEGEFPDVAPRVDETERFVGLDQLCGAAGWADAGIIVPWTLWRVYGDRRIIERHWNAMTRWLDWIERHNPDGLRVNRLGNNYGDWLCIPTDTSFRTHSPMKNLLATAYWADDAAKMAIMAKELGRDQEATRFRNMFERVRAAFQNEFVREDGNLTVETQTAYLLALAFDLLPESMRAHAAERLVENIRSLGWHLSTGFIGISHLNPQLTLAGRADVAYRLLLQEDYPSWLYPVKHGATTIWERWNGWTEEEGFFNPQMNSFNHYSLGSVGEWLFRHAAGIELDPGVPGFQQFVLRPYVEAGLESVRAAYDTMHGTIVSEWKRCDDDFRWRIRIPPNTTAQVFVPGAPGTAVMGNGNAVETASGLRVLGRDDAFLHLAATSGEYQFASKVTVR